jgi:putative SOS response-associated peptidase YedK
VLVIRYNPKAKQRSLDALRWGLIPYWAKDPKIAYKTINARVETVDTNELVAQVHTRMPVILAEEHHAKCLGEIEDGDLKELLKPYPADEMKMWPISQRVNSPKNDDPSLLEAIRV